jgi:hypothetical protein
VFPRDSTTTSAKAGAPGAGRWWRFCTQAAKVGYTKAWRLQKAIADTPLRSNSSSRASRCAELTSMRPRWSDRITTPRNLS